VLLLVGVAVLTAVPVITDKLQLIDLICVAALPFLWRTIARDRLLFALAVTLCLWAAGQVLADQVNGLGIRPSQPLVAAVTILAITPAFVHLSGGDFHRMRFILAGMAVGLAVQLLLGAAYPIGSAAGWKFGYNEPVSILLLAATDLWWRRGQRIPSFLALATICGIAYVTDHRHLAGTAALTALLMTRRRRRRHGRTRVISVIVGVVLLLAALSGIFIQTSLAGFLGDRSAAQVREFGSRPVTILVNVRPEPFQEAYLFAQRPWTGWGSQAQMDGVTYAHSKQFLSDIGVVRDDLDDLWLDSEVPGVSAHSAFMDSLGRAGVWAMPFWLLVVALALWAGTTAVRLRSSPLVVLWTVLVLWDTFFSPMTGVSHIQTAGFLAVAVTTVGSRLRA
jgi:hypothetical protein